MDIVIAILACLCVAGSVYMLVRGFRADEEPAQPIEDSIWVVTCPKAKASALIEVSAGESGIDCEDCSLWPRRLDCNRECLQGLALESAQACAHRR